MASLQEVSQFGGDYGVVADGILVDQSTDKADAMFKGAAYATANPNAVVFVKWSTEIQYTPDPPVVIPPVGASPVFEEAWQYASVADMLGQTHITQYTPNNHASVSPGPGYMEINFAAGQGSGGVDLGLPPVGRRIYIEVPIRYGPGYAVPQDDKTLFLFDTGGSWQSRWTYHVGAFGHGVQFQPDVASGATTAGNLFGQIADGQWHTHRLLADVDTGEAKVWIDDQVILDQTFGPQNGAGFGTLSLHRNNNHAQVTSTWLQYGHVKIYDTDPGW